MKPIQPLFILIIMGSLAGSPIAEAGCIKAYKDRIEELDPPLLRMQRNDGNAIGEAIEEGGIGGGAFRVVLDTKLKHNRKMIEIIGQAKDGGGPAVDELYDEVKRKFKAFKEPKEKMIELIVQGNESNEFCKDPEGRLTTPNDLEAWLKAKGKKAMKEIKIAAKAAEAAAKKDSAVSDSHVKKLEASPTGTPTSDPSSTGKAQNAN